MKQNKKKNGFLLSLCIPTYNRVEKVLYLLDIVKHEIAGLEEEVEVIVSDNHSEFGQLERLVAYSQGNDFFKLYLQKENRGLIGNYYFLIDKAIGKFTWILGDDDIIIEGALKRMTDILKENGERIGCLHLKYNRYINSVNHTMPVAFDYGGIYGFVSDPEEYFLSFAGKDVCGRFLFMSANVFNIARLKSVLIPKEQRDLGDPLYYAMICSKYGLYIDNHISLSQNGMRNAQSWIDEIKDVNLRITASTVMQIPDAYYPYASRKKICFEKYRHFYYSLFVPLRMTSERNIRFFKRLFTRRERLRIYMGSMAYILRKSCNRLVCPVSKIFKWPARLRQRLSYGS